MNFTIISQIKEIKLKVKQNSRPQSLVYCSTLHRHSKFQSVHHLQREHLRGTHWKFSSQETTAFQMFVLEFRLKVESEKSGPFQTPMHLQSTMFLPQSHTKLLLVCVSEGGTKSAQLVVRNVELCTSPRCCQMCLEHQASWALWLLLPRVFFSGHVPVFIPEHGNLGDENS